MSPLVRAYDEVVACDRAVSRWWLKRARAIARAYRAEVAAGFDGFQAPILAATLGVHELTAQRLLTEALAVEALPALAACLDDGRMSPPALSRVLDELSAVDPADAAAVVADLLERTASKGSRTPADWQRAAKRAVVRFDPAAADRRRAAGARDRTLRTRAGGDGMTWVTLLLTAGDAARLVAAVDEAADVLADVDRLRAGDAGEAGDDDRRTSGDDEERRSVGELRADALVALVTGEPAQHGAADDAEQLDLAPSARARRGRRRWQADVVVPAATLRGDSDEPAKLSGHGAITPRHVRELLAEGAEVRAVFVCHETGALLAVGDTRWAVDGADGLRAALDGILRSTARTPSAEARYVPGARLQEFLRTRDRTSVFPCSSVRSDRCDLDHRLPYGRGGATGPENLGALNRRAHRLKQRGLTWTRLADGRVRWSATGRRALHRPNDAGRPPPLVARAP